MSQNTVQPMRYFQIYDIIKRFFTNFPSLQHGVKRGLSCLIGLRACCSRAGLGGYVKLKWTI